MFGIGSRTWYAEYHGMLFNFEWRRDRDYFIAHSNGEAKVISSKDAYSNENWGKMKIRIYASCTDKTSRRQRIKDWHANK